MNGSFARAMLVVAAITVVPSTASAYYAAHMGRFTSRDPFGEAMRIGVGIPNDSGIGFIVRDQIDPAANYHDGMNLYQYTMSNPIVRTDPSGQYFTAPPGYPYPGYPGPPIDPTKVPPGGPYPIGPPCITTVFNKVKPTFGPKDSDKYQHCVMSCHIKRECGILDSIGVGIGKEIIDAIGPGDADWDDIIADKDGWVCKDKPSCEDQCRKKYP